MNGEMWTLPGPREYIKAILRDLLVGRSTILKFPAEFDYSSLIQSLKEEIRREESGWFVRKSVKSLSERMPLPCLAVMEEFDIPINEDDLNENVKLLATAENFVGRIILLDNFSELQPTERKKWWDFLKDYSQVAKTVENYRRTRFIVPLLGAENDGSPEEDVLIAHHWWWGVLTKMEIGFIINKLARERDLMPIWANTVILELAGFDLEFGLFLLEADRDGRYEVLELCLEFARKKGWEEYIDDIKQIYPIFYREYQQHVSSSFPSQQLSRLWQAGIVNQTKFELPDFHSAAVALAGFTEEVTRRTWRGQNRELLILIDLMRVRICHHMTRRFGANWMTWFKGESRLADTSTLEIGQMGGMFKMAPEVKRVEPEVRDTVMWMHFTRNELTHLRPLTRSKLYEGMELIKEASKIV